MINISFYYYYVFILSQLYLIVLNPRHIVRFYYSLFSISYCIRQYNWGLKDQLHLWNPAFLYNLIPLPLIFSLAAKWFGRDWLIFSKVTSYTHVIPIKTNARKMHMGIGNWVFFLLHIYLFYWTLSKIGWQETCKTNE